MFILYRKNSLSLKSNIIIIINNANKGSAFAKHGIGRYHAITAQVLAESGGSRLGVNVDCLRIDYRHGE